MKTSNNTINIVELIERNPITRLSADSYENKLLCKIKENFTEDEQHFFMATFFCHMNCDDDDTKNPFVIDLDEIWKWVGYSRRDHAKQLLEKRFVIDSDYIVEKITKSEDTETKHVSRILLTVDTFKKFCLKSRTKKANEIHDYYIKLQDLYLKSIMEQSDEMQNQLSLALSQQKKEEEQKNPDDEYDPGNCVFFITFYGFREKFKIGSTSNINIVIKDLQSTTLECIDVIELFYIETHIKLENLIKEKFSRHCISAHSGDYDIRKYDEIKKYIIDIAGIKA